MLFFSKAKALFNETETEIEKSWGHLHAVAAQLLRRVEALEASAKADATKVEAAVKTEEQEVEKKL